MREFLVLWEGFPRSEASWEPQHNIHSDIIAAWRTSHSRLKPDALPDTVTSTSTRYKVKSPSLKRLLMRVKFTATGQGEAP